MRSMMALSARPAVQARGVLRVSAPRAPCPSRSVTVAAKRKKGNSGGGATVPSKKSGGGGGGYKAATQRDGAAYEQETRKIILNMDKVSKTAPNGKLLLNKVSLGMYLGAKIGILGANGSGKSTLMNILAGKDTPSLGEFSVNKGIKIGYLEQEPSLTNGATVIENVEPGIAPVRQMLKDYDEVSMKMGEPDADIDALAKTMDKLQTQIDACNGWEVDRQLERAMEALRCPPNDALIENLSGGERRRVALCNLLLSNPDILLLDEPTNHLDAQSVAWLEQYLAEFQGTVVAVTHDRYFLDNVAGWILELSGGKGIPFQGNYSEWLNSKAGRLSSEASKRSGLEKAMVQELEWMNSQAKGQQKKGKARMRIYDELAAEAEQYVKESSLDSITIPVGPRLGNSVVDTDSVSKGYNDRLLINNLNINIPPGSCVGIVGGNGAGKSTLFDMIVGSESPDSGSIKVGETVVPMYVNQSRDSLSDEKSVYDDISEGAEFINLNGREVSSRAYCSWYNFGGADQQKKVKDLSGGERNRLQLAKVLKQAGNLLMLDEPTNDLDVDTLRCLEDAVKSFSGSSLIISHDRWFLDRLCTHILAFEGDSKVIWFEGGYNEYAADVKSRNGGRDPERVKFRKMALS